MVKSTSTLWLNMQARGHSQNKGPDLGACLGEGSMEEGSMAGMREWAGGEWKEEGS